ncbi:hypothetical protein ACLF3G_14250 [Falsiroseomonas sp. HC035]|uniref:hypothetical protein n=1 Tax=Falsiroseomonas sp. HC035 TaxID=3390999 RepID=UPI003D312D08
MPTTRVSFEEAVDAEDDLLKQSDALDAVLADVQRDLPTQLAAIENDLLKQSDALEEIVAIDGCYLPSWP